jgi:hypothetical protein
MEYSFNLFRGGRMVQIGEHFYTGTQKGAVDKSKRLFTSEAVDKVSIENRDGSIIAVVSGTFKPSKSGKSDRLSRGRWTKGDIVPRSNPKPRLTPAQSRALKAYNFALQQEDRYLGSVFVTPTGQRRVEEKTREAYEACKRLGMDHTHGL